MGKGLKIRNVLKKGIAGSFVAVIVLQVLLSTVYFAQASNNYSMLGTNGALGSAILNPNFTAQDWNKWEMLAWGVFLSNFPVPLVDDYDSAFNSNSTQGSKGSAFKALQFGTGSDPANSNTIKSLLNYAVNQQKSGGLKQIYVSFSDIARDGIKRNDLSSLVTDTSTVRPATFKDMFLASSKDDGDSWVKIEDTEGFYSKSKIIPIDENTITKGINVGNGSSEKYLDMATINEGSLPTFYIKYGSSYEKVFDYTDGWDAQLLTAFIARVACGDFKSQFKDLFNDMWAKSSELNLYLDCFGNIVIQYNGSRRIVIPASINQHLTDSPKINLISSMLFNGFTSGISGSEEALIGQQSVSGWFGQDTLPVIGNVDAARFGGLPAMGSHMTNVPQGMITMYYDLDTIAYDNYFHGGTAANGSKTIIGEVSNPVYNLDYGKAVKELFDLDAGNTSGNNYIFKIEAANMDKFDFGFSSDSKVGQALTNMIKASGQIANIAGTNVNAKVLSSIITNNGKVNLFGDPIIVPVQMDNGRTGFNINSSGVGRLFLNYLYEAYKSDKNTLAGGISRDYINTLLTMNETATMKGFKDTVLGINDGTVSKLLAGFVAERNDLFKLNVSADKLIGCFQSPYLASNTEKSSHYVAAFSYQSHRQ